MTTSGTTTVDLFAALVSAAPGEELEVQLPNAQAAENLRTNLAKRYSKYRTTLEALGVPAADIPECVKFKYTTATQTARVSLGARTRMAAAPVSFRIVAKAQQ